MTRNTVKRTRPAVFHFGSLTSFIPTGHPRPEDRHPHWPHQKTRRRREVRNLRSLAVNGRGHHKNRQKRRVKSQRRG